MGYFKIILLFSFTLFVAPSWSQEKYANLTVLLKNIPEQDKEKKINEIYRRQKPKSEEDKLELTFWKFNMMDSLNFEKGAHDAAISLQNSLSKFDNPKRYRVLQHLANEFYEKADYQNAITNSLKIIRLKQIDEAGYANANRTIGLSYTKLGQYDNGAKYLRASLELNEKMNDKKGTAGALMSLGNAYKSQKKFDLALETYAKSIELAKELEDSRIIAGNYNNMGSAYRHKGDIQKAIDFYLQALEINIESGNRSWESFNYNNLANCYYDLKNDKKALEYFKKSASIKLELGDSIAIMETYAGMSRSYANLGDYRNGYDYLYEYVQMKEKYDLAEQTRAIAELEGKYNSEKKESEIQKLKDQKELESLKNDQLETKAERNRAIFILLGFIGILLIGGILWLVRSNRTRQRLNEALHEANKDISRKSSEIIDSINYATQIQRASLPDLSKVKTEKVNFGLFFAPKDIVSGDFFFAYHFGKKLFFGLGDCTGHGVPGAMVSLVGLNAFEKTVNDFPNLNAAEMVEEVNRSVIKSLYRGEAINDGMDVSFCKIDEEAMKANFTGANHTGYLLRKKSSVLTSPTSEHLYVKLENDDFFLYQINGARRPVGKSYSKEPFFEVSFDLQLGDRIIMGTDGYADQFGGKKGKKMKKTGLDTTLLKYASVPIDAQIEELKSHFYSWKGLHEQVDDVCLLVAEVI